MSRNAVPSAWLPNKKICGLPGLDVGSLDVIEVLPLDVNELYGGIPFGRVHVADTVKMRVAGSIR